MENRKSPLLASILSLCFSGFGYLYIGNMQRWLIFFCTICLAKFLILNFLMSQFTGYLLSGLFVFSLTLYATIDTYKQVKSNPKLPRPIQKKRYIVLIFLICSLIEIFLGSKSKFKTYKITSNAMCPLLITGDLFFVQKNALIQRGHVIAYQNIAKNNENFVGRIVGLPGDKILIKDNFLYINGNSIIEKNIDHLPEKVDDCKNSYNSSTAKYFTANIDGQLFNLILSGTALSEDTTEFEVESEKYFIVGDNWNNSFDSRHFGTVSKSEVIGKALFIHFSHSEIVKWNRIGSILNQ